MVYSCAAYNCKNRRKKDSGISFHKFPLENAELLSKWLSAIRRERFNPSIHHRICSAHFTKSCFWKTKGNRILKPDAVPSVFNFPAHLTQMASSNSVELEDRTEEPPLDMGKVKEEFEDESHGCDTTEPNLSPTYSEVDMDIVKYEEDLDPLIIPTVEIKEEQDTIDVADSANENCGSSQTQNGDWTFLEEYRLTMKCSKCHGCTFDESCTTCLSCLTVPEGMYACSLCTDLFIHEHKLKCSCVKSNQKTSSSFICFVCNKAFSLKGNLQKHARVHTGERPFACATCGKAFKQKITLLKHCSVHTRERPFSCDICGKTFSLKDNLDKHAKLHENKKVTDTDAELGNVCKPCDQTFSRTYLLDMHNMTSHFGEQLFHCKTCNKCFPTQDSLKRHLKSHNDDRRFLCPVCGRSYKKDYNLTLHLRSHATESAVEMHS